MQCIPRNEIAYASNDRNEDTIAIECCIPDETGESVSYTHLDVYKRQIISLVVFGISVRKARRILASVAVSTALVLSSKIRIFGLSLIHI